MLRGHLTIAVRQLLAQKLCTVINVAGLALGLACTLLIALFVRHELGYDRHFSNSARIVRISEDVNVDPPQHFAGSSPAIAPLLPEFFPEVAGRRSALPESIPRRRFRRNSCSSGFPRATE